MRIIDVNTFANSFKVKPNNIMSFLLGAGASVSSGIMSGGQMVWDFKRSLYCMGNNLRTNDYADLSKNIYKRKYRNILMAWGNIQHLAQSKNIRFILKSAIL